MNIESILESAANTPMMLSPAASSSEGEDDPYNDEVDDSEEIKATFNEIKLDDEAIIDI